MAEPELETKCSDVSIGDLDTIPSGVLVGSRKENLGLNLGFSFICLSASQPQDRLST